MNQEKDRRPESGRLKQNIVRRINEFRLIAQDNILMVGLLFISVFVFLFILLPLFRVIGQGFFVPYIGTNPEEAGRFSLEYFGRYIDPLYRTHSWNVLRDTMLMGLETATLGTLLGFVFAYTAVRCNGLCFCLYSRAV
jgi:iron(III) transport system permease protein